MLEFLAAELEHLPLVLALSVRRTGSADLRPAVRDCLAELARAHGAVQIALDGLGPDTVRRWLRQTLDAEPPPELAEFLAATTDGNPFYVRELIALLHTEGRLGLDTAAARARRRCPSRSRTSSAVARRASLRRPRC